MGGNICASTPLSNAITTTVGPIVDFEYSLRSAAVSKTFTEYDFFSCDDSEIQYELILDPDIFGIEIESNIVSVETFDTSLIG